MIYKITGEAIDALIELLNCFLGYDEMSVDGKAIVQKRTEDVITELQNIEYARVDESFGGAE